MMGKTLKIPKLTGAETTEGHKRQLEGLLYGYWQKKEIYIKIEAYGLTEQET